LARRPEEGARFVRYFGPLLDAVRALGGSGTPDEVVERIAADLQIPDSVQNELLPSGEPRLRNQVAWARFYLVRDGLVDSSKRGVWSLTERGRGTSLSPEQAREIFLKWVRIFQERRKARTGAPEAVAEQVENEPDAPRTDYRAEVLQLMLSLPAAGFEQLCRRVLREAGFVQVTVTGRSGDQGIDGFGTLQINLLVSFQVLFQCKRYRESVGASQVRDFRGAMAGRADKGMIITTGTFTAEARREASRDGVPPSELIDGDKLIKLLENLELGLRKVATYEIDAAFFNSMSSEDERNGAPAAEHPGYDGNHPGFGRPMDQGEIKQVLLQGLTSEERADELAESAAMQPYIRLAVALLEGKSLRDSVTEIAALPLEQRYVWRVLSALKWGFADFDSVNAVIDRKTLRPEDRGRIADLVMQRPIQFCLFLKALFGERAMERMMLQAIDIAKKVGKDAAAGEEPPGV
jgi:restriction system protein